MQAFNNWIGE